MNLSLLDNPAWHSLLGHHQQFAIHGEIAARYPADVLFAGAMPEYSVAGFNNLHTLFAEKETVGIVGGELPAELTGWKILATHHLPQMICTRLKKAEPIEVVELTLDDAPEMMALVALTKPGPFAARTVLVGQYIGVRHEGKLVAMAGERLHPDGFCEVSAVCTHPDYRGRGYASRLTSLVAQNILDRNEIPFLHLMPTNEVAMRVYEGLGFTMRTTLPFSVLRKVKKKQ